MDNERTYPNLCKNRQFVVKMYSHVRVNSAFRSGGRGEIGIYNGHLYKILSAVLLKSLLPYKAVSPINTYKISTDNLQQWQNFAPYFSFNAKKSGVFETFLRLFRYFEQNETAGTHFWVCFPCPRTLTKAMRFVRRIGIFSRIRN